MLEVKRLNLTSEIETAKRDVQLTGENPKHYAIVLIIACLDPIYTSPTVWKMRFHDDTIAAVKQLSESLSFIRQEVDVETERLRRETEVAQENEKITEVLTQKLAQARKAGKLKEKQYRPFLRPYLPLPKKVNKATSPPHLFRADTDVKGRLTELDESNKMLMNELSAFINEYYPDPNDDEEETDTMGRKVANSTLCCV